MKKHLPMFMTIVFCFTSLVLVFKAIALTKDTTMLRLQIVAKNQQAKQSGMAELQAFEVVTVRQAVEGIAWHYRLPLVVEQQKNVLTIAPPVVDKTGTNAGNGEYEVLKDYQAVLGFLSAVSTLPYKLDIKQLCVGTECQNGFAMVAEVKGK